MSLYSYRPLDVERNEIRLLVLQPGVGNSTVEVEILHEFLEKHPTYESLSYVWGDPTVTKAVHVVDKRRKSKPSSPRRRRYSHHISKATTKRKAASRSSRFTKGNTTIEDRHSGASNHVFEATTNLEAALRHLRLVDEPRLLWVDAICINQQDDNEKGHQVRQMGRIYQKCFQVCLWLGEAADDSDYAMDLLIYYQQSRKHLVDERIVEVFSNDSSRQFTRFLRAIECLICRPWFTRLWVVQEIALAPASTILCGTKFVKWRSLFNVVFALVYNIKTRGLPKYLDDFNQRQTLGKIEAGGLSVRFRSAATTLFELNRLINVTASGNLPPLRGLFSTINGKGMADKRDAIYALLSIAGDLSCSWDVDYGITWLQVFRNTVERVIATSGSLDIICHAKVCRHQTNPTLSWLPRFDGESLGCGCSLFSDSSLTMAQTVWSWESGENVSPYNASRGIKPQVSDLGNRLMSGGLIVDRVKRILDKPKPVERNKSDWIVPKQWFSLALQPTATHPRKAENNPSRLDPDKFDALWRTIVSNRALWAKNALSPHFGDCLRSWLESEDGDFTIIEAEYFDPNASSPIQIFKRHVFRAVSDDKTLIVTEQDRLGLARTNTVPGDLVATLIGCSIPMILRPVPDAESEKYILIGESYIHGIMDGEAIDKLDAGEYELKEITLV